MAAGIPILTAPTLAHSNLRNKAPTLSILGPESTSPGSQRISAEEEWRRLGPVLKKLKDKLTIPISLDTYKAETAERALELGVEIINDPSGLTFDADLAKTVSNANAGLILNHMRGTPETWAKLPPLPDIMGVGGARSGGDDQSGAAGGE